MSRLIDKDALLGTKVTIAEDDAAIEAAREVGLAIVNALTIDAVPVVHGRWIWNEERCEWVCDKCSLAPVDGLPFDDLDYEPDMKYCPNCGARMDQEVDGDG